MDTQQQQPARSKQHPEPTHWEQLKYMGMSSHAPSDSSLADICHRHPPHNRRIDQLARNVLPQGEAVHAFVRRCLDRSDLAGVAERQALEAVRVAVGAAAEVAAAAAASGTLCTTCTGTADRSYQGRHRVSARPRRAPDTRRGRMSSCVPVRPPADGREQGSNFFLRVFNVFSKTVCGHANLRAAPPQQPRTLERTPQIQLSLCASRTCAHTTKRPMVEPWPCALLDCFWQAVVASPSEPIDSYSSASSGVLFLLRAYPDDAHVDIPPRHLESLSLGP